MHKVEPSKLQYLALQFAEKAAVFVENNERLLDSKTGNNFYKEQGGKGAQGGQQGQDRRQDRSWQDVSTLLNHSNTHVAISLSHLPTYM